MRRLENLNFVCDHVEGGHGLDDDVMASCIPSLAACTGMRELSLSSLGLGVSSCAALSAIFPRMTGLQKLVLYKFAWRQLRRSPSSWIGGVQTSTRIEFT